MKLDVKLEKLDDELMFKRVHIKNNEKNITTPIVTSYKGHPISYVNEIYKVFSLDKLKKISSNEEVERKVNSEIRNLMTEKTNFLIVDYPDIELPTTRYIEVLSDIQYSNSDIVITPICSGISRNLKEDRLLDNFLSLTNQFIEIVETLNNRSIIGVIPSRMPRQFLDKIIENYYSQNITSFLIDFDGRSIDTNPSWVRNLMRLIKQYDLMENSFLYSVNTNAGKFIKNSTKIVAKDFISIGFGIDILGLNHVPPRMTNEAWLKIKKQRTESSLRMFERSSYGYVKKSTSDLMRLRIQNRDELKKYNLSEKFNESITLQNQINENATLESYMKSKSQVSLDILDKMKKIRKETFQPNLSSFF